MRTRVLAIVAVVSILAGVSSVAVASPPERTEEPLFIAFPDLENRLAVFWNITRDDFCAWEASGFAGPPPVEQPVQAQMVETGKGALVGSLQANRIIEIWMLDQDVPPLVGPCEDTDGQAGPWATGTARLALNDNDLDVSLTRMNSFGDRGVATVHDSDGQSWHYSWTARLQIDRDGMFRVVTENFNLRPMG